jgi:hypothetical protein
MSMGDDYTRSHRQQQLGTGVVQRGEAELIENDQVVAQQEVPHRPHIASSFGRRRQPLRRNAADLATRSATKSLTWSKFRPRPLRCGPSPASYPSMIFFTHLMPRRRLIPGMHQSGLVGGCSRLRTVVQTQLHQDTADVGLYGCFTQNEMPSDLIVRQPMGDKNEHLPLRRRQLRQCGGGNVALRACCKIAQQAAGYRRVEPCLPRGYGVDRADQLIGLGTSARTRMRLLAMPNRRPHRCDMS